MNVSDKDKTCQQWTWVTESSRKKAKISFKLELIPKLIKKNSPKLSYNSNESPNTLNSPIFLLESVSVVNGVKVG